MTFKFAEVARNLPTKGFVADLSTHHAYFYFFRGGLKTRFYTYVSHGKPSDDVGDGIVRSMKRQLGLATAKQVRDLVECPMSGDAYLAALIASGSLPENPPEPPQGHTGKTTPNKKK